MKLLIAALIVLPFIIIGLWCSLVLGSDDDDRNGRG